MAEPDERPADELGDAEGECPVAGLPVEPATAAGFTSLSTLPLDCNSAMESVRELFTEFRIFIRIL